MSYPYYPCEDELEVAVTEWGCNCGPAAIAAIMRISLPRLHHVMKKYGGWPGYTTPTKVQQMFVAWALINRVRVLRENKLPDHGLAFIQLLGPWMKARVPAQYKHTHWIAVDGDRIFDINNNDEPWYTKEMWEQFTILEIIDRHKDATGWVVRLAYEIPRHWNGGKICT